MASSACTSVTFEGAPTPHLRNVLERSRRQYVPAVHLPTNHTVLYWVTPKAAHTRIVRLLRRPPFATMPTKATDAYYGSSVIDFGSMMHPGAECLGAKCLSRHLRQRLAERPFEFTFVREPLGGLIAATFQVVFCMNSGSNEKCWKPPRRLNLTTGQGVVDILEMALHDKVPDEFFPAAVPGEPKCLPSATRLLSMRGCFRHAYPQSAGYGWDAAGMARLHFVGTIENFVDDWQALLARLEPGAPPRATPPQDLRTVNRRSKELPAALQPGGGEWAALERHPAVVRHLAADRRCLPAAALHPNVSQGSEAWCRLQRAKCRAPRG